MGLLMNQGFPPMPKRTEKTYLLLCPSAGLVKIGMSYRPVQRMAALRTMSPVPVEPLLVLRVPEAELHKKFALYREHGEWFRCSSEMVAWLAAINQLIAADRLEQVVRNA